MYKFLLCVRYLRTRYIALASIVSVMLGVATMIVVNSVMSGFATEMRERINGILADIIIETNSLNGEFDADYHKLLAMQAAGDHIESISATVEVFGLVHFERNGQWIPRPVTLVGIDPESECQVGPLVEHLDSYQTIREDGRLVRKPLRSMDEPPTWNLTEIALAHRQERMERQRHFRDRWPIDPPGAGDEPQRLMPDAPDFEPGPASKPNELAEETVQPPVGPIGPPGEPQPEAVIQPAGAVENETGLGVRQAADPFVVENQGDFDPTPNLPFPDDPADNPEAPHEARVFIGAGLIEYLQEDREGNVAIRRMVQPGDDVKISTVSAGSPPEPVHFWATIADVYKSGMSEYDGNLVFCSLKHLQQVRGMLDPQSNKGAITTLKIKLKDYNSSETVIRQLRNVFPPHLYTVQTWEAKQGPLLAAVDIESAILNMLLFLIIAVAGFGILAIFFMIVVEKTRDIGILKALGASSNGVMSIFLSYGLGLGLVGSGVGVVLGLTFVSYINEIEAFLAVITGRKVFDERIYYFPEIPTQVSAFTVTWVALGAILIAVLASVLPARRAARLHPVQALRAE